MRSQSRYGGLLLQGVPGRVQQEPVKIYDVVRSFSIMSCFSYCAQRQCVKHMTHFWQDVFEGKRLLRLAFEQDEVDAGRVSQNPQKDFLTSIEAHVLLDADA